MNLYVEPAWAKLNLTLDVLGSRPDGYHDLQMVMQTVSLHDDVAVRIAPEGSWKLGSSRSDLPQDGRNLALRAAEAYFAGSGLHPGLEIWLEKRIPSEAGLAGGSADAAAVLRVLNRHFRLYSERELAARALQVGSDVPYCLRGGTMLAEGRGERLRKLRALGQCTLLICKPVCSISTPELFRTIDERPIGQRPNLDEVLQALQTGDTARVAMAMCNVFEPLAIERHPEIGRLLAVLRRAGAAGAVMTGTGSAVFGLFLQRECARQAQAALFGVGQETFLTQPV